MTAEQVLRDAVAFAYEYGLHEHGYDVVEAFRSECQKKIMLHTSAAMGFGEGADLQTPQEVGDLFNRVHESGIEANNERNAVMAHLHYLLGGACPATPTVPEACHPDVCDCNSPYMEMTLVELIGAVQEKLESASAK